MAQRKCLAVFYGCVVLYSCAVHLVLRVLIPWSTGSVLTHVEEVALGRNGLTSVYVNSNSTTRTKSEVPTIQELTSPQLNSYSSNQSKSINTAVLITKHSTNVHQSFVTTKVRKANNSHPSARPNQVNSGVLITNPSANTLKSSVTTKPNNCGSPKPLSSIFTNGSENWDTVYKKRFNANVLRFNQALPPNISLFRPTITVDEYTQLINTFFVLCDALFAYNVTFMLHQGAALGAYRHMGVVPWDDDIDVLIDLRDKDKTHRALSAQSQYKLRVHKHLWKFHSSTTHRMHGSIHYWPFIDIFFFDQNKTHIWETQEIPNGMCVYRKSDVLPLVYWPFEGRWMPVPCALQTVINVDYDNGLCLTNWYSHKRDKSYRSLHFKCSILYEFYPFVFPGRSRIPGCMSQSLQIGNTVLSTYDLPSTVLGRI